MMRFVNISIDDLFGTTRKRKQLVVVFMSSLVKKKQHIVQLTWFSHLILGSADTHSAPFTDCAIPINRQQIIMAHFLIIKYVNFKLFLSGGPIFQSRVIYFVKKNDSLLFNAPFALQCIAFISHKNASASCAKLWIASTCSYDEDDDDDELSF